MQASTAGRPEADAARRAAWEELDRARQAVGDVGARSWRSWRPWPWWTCSDQEQAWLAVHAAEAHLALARPEAAVRAELPELEAKVRARFRASDTRMTSWAETLTKSRDPATPLDRYAIREMKEALFERSDGGHARMRSFRNMLDHVWQAELLGALGGLLAVLAALQRLRGFRTLYNLPLVQALLKIPAGALTGLLGLVLMQGGVFFLEPQRGSALVAYVIFFGASHVITRLIDRKAGEIAETAADPEAASSGAAGGG
jgi:hypothetical protein